MRGIKPEDIEVFISDGSVHILQKIFLPLFPNSVHILDYYHKTEALHKCLKTNNSLETKQELKKYLWEGKMVLHHIEWVNHFWYGRFSFNVPLIINC